MSKKKDQPHTINNFYVGRGGVVNNLNTDLGACRPYQYDSYVFMFQSIMGELALIKEVRLLHWRVIALMISRMEASGRIIFYPQVAAGKLSYTSARYVSEVIDDLMIWNVIIRPNKDEESIYMFNQRFLFKGRVSDNFHPFLEAKLFPEIGYDVGPQPRSTNRMESNEDFDQEGDPYQIEDKNSDV